MKQLEFLLLLKVGVGLEAILFIGLLILMIAFLCMIKDLDDKSK